MIKSVLITIDRSDLEEILIRHSSRALSSKEENQYWIGNYSTDSILKEIIEKGIVTNKV